MGKKIMLLNASPRRHGNSDKIAQAFTAGAQQKGNEVTRFDAAFMDIGGCTACDRCWSKGEACVIEDDFKKLEPYYESSDVLLLISPLYWGALPAQVKGAIDRLYAYGGSGGPKPLAIREAAFILIGELETGHIEYKPAVEAFRLMCDYLGWDNRGVIVQGGLGKADDVLNTDALRRVEEFGREI